MGCTIYERAKGLSNEIKSMHSTNFSNAVICKRAGPGLARSFLKLKSDSSDKKLSLLKKLASDFNLYENSRILLNTDDFTKFSYSS